MPDRRVSAAGVMAPPLPGDSGGFSLVETMVALFVLTIGILATAQILSLAVSATTLARSKGTAAIAAQDQLERLADLFRRDPADADLSLGEHGPHTVEVSDPSNGRVLNRFDVTWAVAVVPDVRTGRTRSARQVSVKVSPVDGSGGPNHKVLLNKVVSVASVLSTRLP